MAQCELCGNNVKNLLEAKISGATLNVCPDCTDLGTITDKQKEENKKETKTKYNTSKTSNNTNKMNTSNQNKNSVDNTTNHNNRNKEEEEENNYFDEVNDLSLNYGDKIRDARNSKGYTRKELSNKMNIKESNLRNIEDEKTQPVIELQKKLENELDIDLGVEDIDY
jgi:putative transcription factor